VSMSYVDVGVRSLRLSRYLHNASQATFVAICLKHNAPSFYVADFAVAMASKSNVALYAALNDDIIVSVCILSLLH
jgi:hypothetical protein